MAPNTARPSLRELRRELRDVGQDVPALLTAPLYRKWHLRWGATPAEVAASLPGDELLAHAEYRSTRAITIDAPPEAVWPWLVQVGCRRGGFYSNDLLDNLGRPSAERIVPGMQALEIGQWVPMSPSATPSERTAFKVAAFDVNESLLWTKPDSTWAWQLTRTGTGTRVVTRIHAGLRLAAPAVGNRGCRAHGVRRLRHAAENVARHQVRAESLAAERLR